MAKKIAINLAVHVDRLLLHDQPVPGRDCHPVLRDEAAGDGQDEGGAGKVQLLLHSLLLHKQVRRSSATV